MLYFWKRITDVQYSSPQYAVELSCNLKVVKVVFMVVYVIVVTRYLFNVTFIACDIEQKAFISFFVFGVIFCSPVIDTSTFVVFLFFVCNCIPQQQLCLKTAVFLFKQSKAHCVCIKEKKWNCQQINKKLALFCFYS